MLLFLCFEPVLLHLIQEPGVVGLFAVGEDRVNATKRAQGRLLVVDPFADI